jgi:hypothetical protein
VGTIDQVVEEGGGRAVTRRTNAVAVTLAMVSATLSGAALRAQPPTRVDKVPIVAVIGCITEQGADWMLTNATEPTPSMANAPPAGTKIEGPTSGTNTFRLIGTSEFDLPAHEGHTMLVKALYIEAEPHVRLNVTSVTMVAESCPAPPR